MSPIWEIEQTPTFRAWICGLRDRTGAAIILRRLDRLALGNFGDAKPLGDALSEIRIDYWPGYRVYFVRRGTRLIVLLCGGDKGSQRRDIAEARRLSEET